MVDECCGWSPSRDFEGSSPEWRNRGVHDTGIIFGGLGDHSAVLGEIRIFRTIEQWLTLPESWNQPEARVQAIILVAGQIAAQGSFLVNQPKQDE